jgi:hypothetical protein
VIIGAQIKVKTLANFSQIMPIADGMSVDKVPTMEFKDGLFVEQCLRVIKVTETPING